MPVIGSTKVISEALEDTYLKAEKAASLRYLAKHPSGTDPSRAVVYPRRDCCVPDRGRKQQAKVADEKEKQVDIDHDSPRGRREV